MVVQYARVAHGQVQVGKHHQTIVVHTNAAAVHSEDHVRKRACSGSPNTQWWHMVSSKPTESRGARHHTPLV